MTAALARGSADAVVPFLAALASPHRERLPFRIVVVVAHPDDETIGCGALLVRLIDARIIHVTDGAPRNAKDAEARGFGSPQDYAAARRRELEAAVALAGIAPDRLMSLGWPDQQASFHLAEIATQLRPQLAEADIVLTHAYEGGHPDHDATAFAVHAACALLRPIGSAPFIVEMPLYRAGPDQLMPQAFVPVPGLPEVAVTLNPEERRLKHAMFAAHATQRDVLGWFAIEVERFRPTPAYDFTRLPNSGALYYDQFDWGMTGPEWLNCVAEAQTRLRLRGSA